MKETVNYQLNQWEKQDRVMMEDFNRDNSRTDAALKQLSERTTLVPLKTVPISTPIKGEGAAVTIDVSDIAWDVWQYVCMDLNLEGFGEVRMYANDDRTDSQCRFFSALNGTIVDSSLMSGVDVHKEGAEGVRIVFRVYENGTRKIHLAVEDSDCVGWTKTCTYDQLHSLRLRLQGSSGRIDRGTVIFRGVR